MELPETLTMRSAKGTIEVPSVGFGTWAFGETGWCYEATRNALKAGYKHFDCAWNYGTDKQVGDAIRDSGIPREHLFITTKFWPHWGAPQNVEKCLDACLNSMRLDYIDLYLAHWPVVLQAGHNLSSAKATPEATNEERGIRTDSNGHAIIDYEHTCTSISASHGKRGSFGPTWQAMQRLVETGKVRAVGVSNFNIQQLEEVLNVGGSIPLSCNQVEAHPLFANSKLLDFMADKAILRTVYCPFAGQKSEGVSLVQNPTVREMAKRNQMGVGQLLQSWAVQRGTIPLGKSQTPGTWDLPYDTPPSTVTDPRSDRIIENLAVHRLPKEDFELLSRMDEGEEGRTVDLGHEWGVSFY